MDENKQPPSGMPDNSAPTNPLPDNSMQQPQPVASQQKSRGKKWIWVAVALLGLALVAGGALYWFVLRDTAGGQPAAQATDSQDDDGQQSAQPAVADSTPQTFKSTKLNIELTHRKDWTLKESSDGAITITSPGISYATADGTSKTGVFTLYLRKGASDAQRTTIDKAIATKDSEVIAYAAPTEGQREYTNLSFAGPKDMFGFFIITGNAEFKAGAPLMYALPLDGEFYLIAGGYGTNEANSLTFDAVPKDTMDSSTLEQALDIVKSLKIH